MRLSGLNWQYIYPYVVALRMKLGHSSGFQHASSETLSQTGRPLSWLTLNVGTDCKQHNFNAAVKLSITQQVTLNQVFGYYLFCRMHLTINVLYMQTTIKGSQILMFNINYGKNDMYAVLSAPFCTTCVLQSALDRYA